MAWRPNPGRNGRENPQAIALASQVDEVFYGGAKGGAKTDTLAVKPLYHVHRPRFACAFVRQTFRELERPLDRMTAIYSALPVHMRPAWTGDKKRFTFPSGAIIQLGYTEKGLGWAQGGNWGMVCWDEMGNEPDEKKCDDLVSELRCPDPDVLVQLVGSGNPGFAGHPWVKRRYVTPCGKDGSRIAWSKVDMPDGTVEWVSRQFVPARITDNPTYANDRKYMAKLMSLPERMRRCLLDGDWDAATGLALDEVEEAIHIVPSFSVPKHWPWAAGFDWGFAHNAVYIYARVSEDGRVYVIDTIKRRLLRDWDLAGVYEELVPVGARTNVHAGSDVKSEIKARDDQKSTQETFGERGIHLVLGNQGRVHGYLNMLTYLAWRGSSGVEGVPDREPRQPMVQFFDTPGNRWLVEQLTQMVNDPDDPRDVLKVDADPESGEGGDDGYDALRVLLMSRPLVAKSGFEEVEIGAFDPIMLRAAAERAAKASGHPVRRKRRYF